MVRGVPRHTKCGGGAQSSVVADESNQSSQRSICELLEIGWGARRVGCSISPAEPARSALVSRTLRASLSVLPLRRRPRPPFRVPGSPRLAAGTPATAGGVNTEV